MKNLLHNILTGILIIPLLLLTGCKKRNANNNDENNYNGKSGYFTDTRDQKKYKWVKIGNQIWMAEDLTYTGSDMEHITGESQWITNTDYNGWCYYNNDNNSGILYQWQAALTACPGGWHLPTDEEWTELENYLIQNGYAYNGVAGNDGIAKSLASDYGWEFSNVEGAVGNTDFPEARNKTGFSGFPNGVRNGANGYFLLSGTHNYWWSATETPSDNTQAFGRFIAYNQAIVTRFSGNKLFGFAVRCIKDE